MVAGLYFERVAFTIPGWLGVVVGAAMLVGAGLRLWRVTSADRIVDPRRPDKA